MYAIFAQAFPTHVRAAGTGFGIGVGRGGSVLAPIIAGYLFKDGVPVPTVAMYLAARFAGGGDRRQLPEAQDGRSEGGFDRETEETAFAPEPGDGFVIV